MNKNELLYEVAQALYDEHCSFSLEMGDGISGRSQYHKKHKCAICDLLREVDESVKPISTSILLCCTVDCTEERQEGIDAFRNHECKCTCEPKTIWPGRPVD